MASERAILKTRPTLFVALGGAGAEVLLRLRRRIVLSEWNGNRVRDISEFPVARFVYFDADRNAAEDRESSRAADSLSATVRFLPGEMLNRRVDIEKYQRDIHRHPHIEEWLPHTNLRSLDTNRGAGQVRAISRLGFFDAFRDFRSIVERKCLELRDSASREDDLKWLGIDASADLRVVVVASTAGGTGSGSFIDAGLSIGSIVPGVSQRDLFLVLPTAYRHANTDRIFANTYAAFSELEHVMRPNPRPRYAPNGWDGSPQSPGATDAPYDDVYLFDSVNMAGLRTERIDQIYDMMADALFEDFGNSEFARRKRNILVNQAQHKFRMYRPAVPDAKGGELAFSRRYSAMGQSTLTTGDSLEREAAVADLCLSMLREFVGIAEPPMTERTPTADECEAFIAKHLSLELVPLPGSPSALRSDSDGEYELIDRLLRDQNGHAIGSATILQMTRSIGTLPTDFPDVRTWAEKVREIESTYLGSIGEENVLSHGLALEITSARRRLAEKWKSEGDDESLWKAVRHHLDHPENGSFGYVIALIGQVAARLDDEHSGILARIDKISEEYDRRADEILRDYSTRCLGELYALKPSSVANEKSRQVTHGILRSAQESLGNYLTCRLRAASARESRALLEEAGDFLGRMSPAKEPGGDGAWTGIAGSLRQDYHSIRRILDTLRADADRLRENAHRPTTGARRTIPGARPAPQPLAQADVSSIASEAFLGFGGRSRFLSQIRDDDSRAALLGQLHMIAKGRLSELYKTRTSVADVLRMMPADERSEVIGDMMRRSLPWIDADLGTDMIGTEQLRMTISVHGAREFAKDFASELGDETARVQGLMEPACFESEDPDQIVFHCELSGLPLTALNGLRESWKHAYEFEQRRPDAVPVHNHHDITRFPSPVVPTGAEIQEVRESLKLMLKGICLGLLRREPGPDRVYFVEYGPGDRRDVGTERTLTRRGFSPPVRKRLESDIAMFEQSLSPIQLLALSALFEWTADKAYAPRRQQYEERDERRGGLAHHVARELRQDYEHLFESAGGIDGIGNALLTAVRKRLYRRISDWTSVLEGSLGDVDQNESNVDRSDRSEFRGADKRQLDPLRFETGALEAIADLDFIAAREETGMPLVQPVAGIERTGASDGIWLQSPPDHPRVSAHKPKFEETVTLFWPHAGPEKYFADFFRSMVQLNGSGRRIVEFFYDDRAVAEEFDDQADDENGLLAGSDEDEWMSLARFVRLEFMPSLYGNNGYPTITWYEMHAETSQQEAGVSLSLFSLDEQINTIGRLIGKTHIRQRDLRMPAMKGYIAGVLAAFRDCLVPENLLGSSR